MSALAPCAPPADHLLVDGGLAILRPLVPDEPERIQEVFDALSDRSRYLRFHAATPRSDRDRAPPSGPRGRLRAGSRGRHDRHPRRRHRAVGEVRRRAARRRARRRGRRPLPATRDRPGAGGDRRRRRRRGGRRPDRGHRPPGEQAVLALDAGRRRRTRGPAMRASSSSRRPRWSDSLDVQRSGRLTRLRVIAPVAPPRRPARSPSTSRPPGTAPRRTPRRRTPVQCRPPS